MIENCSNTFSDLYLKNMGENVYKLCVCKSSLLSERVLNLRTHRRIVLLISSLNTASSASDIKDQIIEVLWQLHPKGNFHRLVGTSRADHQSQDAPRRPQAKLNL